jgi:dTDP-glucose 4,6-dehydratase
MARRLERALVTGGAGFIGSHLCDRLLAEGCRVLAYDNLLTGRMENIQHLLGDPRFDFEHYDVTNYLHVAGELDAILHGLAKAKGARFLLASTSECYGDPEVNPQPETYWGNVNPVGVRGVYDEAKRFAEAMAMAYHRHHGVDVRIVRIFNTFGPRMQVDDGRAIPNFIRQAIRSEDVTVYGDGRQTRSIQYVDDLVEGIWRLLNCEYVGPVNIGSDNEITMYELARTIIRIAESSSQIVKRPLPPDDPKVRRADNSLAKEVLDWEPRVPPEEGLRRTIEYFRAELARSSSA